MKETHASRLTGLLLSFALTTTATSTAFADTPDDGDPQTFGHSLLARGRPLELPATTACLQNVLAGGTAAHALSGMAVAVVLDGRIVYHRGFGTVSPGSSQPVLPSTRFRFGSITKAMTAMALLSYAQEGRIRLHAPVTDLLPGFTLLGGEPGWSERLTPHLLLTHQGGMPDAPDRNGPGDDGALAALFYDPAFLETVPLMVAPGTFYNYSNTNFSLAGLLVERAAGLPYREAMRRRVFKPLGMKRTVFLPSEVMADNDFAYGIFNGEVIAPDAFDDAVLRPAGTAWGSVDDLARFMEFLLDGNPWTLSPRMWRAQQTRQVDTFELLDLEGYGYGVFVEKDAGLRDSQNQLKLYPKVKVIWHEGAIDGYRAFFWTLPRQRFGYAVLYNAHYDAPVASPAQCYQVAVRETISSRLPAPLPWPGPDIQRDRFADYVGHYADRIGVAGRAIVSLTPNGDLSIRFPDLDGLVAYDPILHPTRRDNFELHIDGLNIGVTGIRQGDDSIAYLRTRFTVLARTADSAASLRGASSPARMLDLDALRRALRAASMER
jgi:beta-lactamase class C